MQSLRRKNFSASTLDTECEEWIQRQSETSKNAWLTALVNSPSSAVRSEILAKYRADAAVPAWPTTKANRTLTQLRSDAAEIAQKAKQREAAKAALDRKTRLAKMAANPRMCCIRPSSLWPREPRPATSRLLNYWSNFAKPSQRTECRTWLKSRLKNSKRRIPPLNCWRVNYAAQVS